MAKLVYTLEDTILKEFDLKTAIVYEELCKDHNNAKLGLLGLIHEENYWIAGTQKLWVQRLPFLTNKKLSNIFRKLEDKGYISIRKGLGENTFNYTNWITIKEQK